MRTERTRAASRPKLQERTVKMTGRDGDFKDDQKFITAVSVTGGQLLPNRQQRLLLFKRQMSISERVEQRTTCVENELKYKTEASALGQKPIGNITSEFFIVKP